MKILIILCSEKMLLKYLPNIQILKNYTDELEMMGHTVDYAGISSSDDFVNYETVISFKYKMRNLKKQLSKVCDFVKYNKNSLNYDWYIKFRPEIVLFEQFNFTTLSDTAINARARRYVGPQTVKYGCSVGGEGCWQHVNEIYYEPVERVLDLDDILYIFHNNVIEKGAFTAQEPYTDQREDETFHTHHWKLRGIPLNIIGINMDFTRYTKALSSHIEWN
jgi:hypothetical protein